MLHHSIMLKTKTAMPAVRSNSVHRSRLLQKMDAGLQCRLTTLYAPAGYGKTTLLSQWAHQYGGTTVWLSLDEMDNDLIRFWRYIVFTLSESDFTELSERMEPAMKATSHTSIFTFIDSLLNELASTTQPLAIILDDYHVISDETIHNSLAYFLEYVPSHVHLYIASRNTLPFSTVKWNVRHEVCHIESGQFLFSHQETDSFYRQVHDLPLTQMQIEQLVKSTEGWIAGLQLAAISLVNMENYDQFFAGFTGSHRNISEYLFHEVIMRLPEEERSFLLKTSVLARMDAHVCHALTSLPQCQQMLTRLHRQNIFLIPLDDYGTWYRYHHLFADFLRSQLEQTAPGEARELHRLASESYAERGLMDEAIDHAIAAADYPLAVRLLEQHTQVLLQRGEFSSFLRTLDSIPDHANYFSPLFRLIYTFLLITCVQIDRAEVALTELEQNIPFIEDPTEHRQFLSGLFFVRANLVFATMDFDRWIASSSQLSGGLPESPLFYHFNYNTTEPFIRRTRFGLKGILSEQTEVVGNQFSAILEANGWKDSLINMYVVQALAEGFYEENRLEESLDYLQRVRFVALHKQIPGLLVPYVLTSAKLKLVEGNFVAARKIVSETVEMLASWGASYWFSPLQAFLAHIAIQEGDIALAKTELSKLPPSILNQPSIQRELEVLTYVRLLLAQQQEQEALRILTILKPSSIREELLISQVDIAILQALAHQQCGNKKEALAFLHEALLIGGNNCYVRSFLDEGTAMSHLLHDYQLRLKKRSQPPGPSVSTAYVNQLLSLFPKKMEKRKAPLIEPLTGKEMIILSMLAQGASNKMIADELGNTLGTVKVYLHRIYGKLGVTNRTQALLKAQEISLLENNAVD
ncbi:LuxR C-terminal-related transcriptional regulator [Brevibacillus sp. MS2.2]|uniref:LuxR C-terminal-related transcriptional regulator n=1 Tax=Brevibacillus sp. MS2.2 TaxID=2738981 RepID=UPI00156AE6CD|nr:LuxR C-terminal-related transcriptional regulator [Brevibacillus sp. MS2.2]NRR21239.1 transcriptional regulator [Brevibacillus sp. MS2.2]